MANDLPSTDNLGTLRGPLDVLRQRIRKYILLDALFGVICFMAVWLWVDLAVDYGSFRIFGADLVQVLPRYFRIAALLFLLGGFGWLLLRNLFLRLRTELRDEALALSLERQFPGSLGDRLITAIQLADPVRARERGASAEMVQQTVMEAARIVGTLNLDQTLDWQRLKVLARRCLHFTFGGYLLGLLLFVAGAAPAVPEGETSPGAVTLYHDTLITWAERDLLVRNIIWPRHAFVEVIGFPDSGTVRVGRDAPPYALQARAVHHAVAGRASGRAVERFREYLQKQNLESESAVNLFGRRPPEGWRAITFFDLPDWVSAPLPELGNLPADLKPARAAEAITLDEIEVYLEKTQAELESLAQLRKALEEIRTREKSSLYRRKLRLLKVPDQVLVRSWGASTSNNMTLQRGAGNEFTGLMADLRETVDFTLEAVDYRTSARRLQLVPPPMLLKLMVQESHPAYLYHRTEVEADGTALKGLKQVFEAQDMLQPGSDMSRISVPEGSDVKVTASCDTDIKQIRAVLKDGSKASGLSPVLTDPKTFGFEVTNIREERTFYLEYEDAEGVLGRRGVVIKPKADEPPVVDFEVDSLRRTKDGFLVTPLARIPIKGNASDAHGLGQVRYAYNSRKIETEALDVKSLFLLSSITQFIPTEGSGVRSLAFLGAVLPAGKPKETEPAKDQRYFNLPSFRALLAANPGELKPLAEIQKQLANPIKLSQKPAITRSFQIQPDNFENIDEEPKADFPLWKQGLAQPGGSGSYQPRFRMEIWLEALDHDVETGPHLVASKDRYLFLVVPEADLLAEIGREEEKHKVALETVKGQLLEAEARLGLTGLDLSSPGVTAAQLGPMVARSEEIERSLETRQAAVAEVLDAYVRILREMKLNRVEADRQKRVFETIHEPLRKIMGVEFPATTRAMVDFRSNLDDAAKPLPQRLIAGRESLQAARTQFKRLLTAIDEVLAAMGTLTDINKLVATLRAIEEEERKQYDLIQKIHEELVKKTLEDVLNPGK